MNPISRLPGTAFLWAAALLAPLQVSAVGLSPRENWRAKPVRIEASGNAGALSGLVKGKSSTWRPGAAGLGHWIAMRFPDSLSSAVMLTYSASSQVRAYLEASLNTTDGRNGNWLGLDTSVSGPYLNKIDIPPPKGVWLRVRFKGAGAAQIKIWNLGLYAPRPGFRNDYWLALGASIQNQSMRQARFHPTIRRAHPRADPVLFNLAVRGWNSADLLGNLPALLEAHPYAGYALIHIGGNDVSASRPFPGYADELKANLEAILDTLENAGIVPVLSRLSYRRYAGDLAVPPDENGSGPYVTEIYDPICSRRTPEFFDPETGRCAMDLYSWFQRRPQELSADGIHLNIRGEESWSLEWARVAGGIIYGSRSPAGGDAPNRRVERVSRRAPIRFGPSQAAGKKAWTLQIRDVSGRIVHGSRDGGWGLGKPAVWNLRDMYGRPVASGPYTYTFHNGWAVSKGILLVLE